MTLMRLTVLMLRLRPDAPFPSQIRRPGKWCRLALVRT